LLVAVVHVQAEEFVVLFLGADTWVEFASEGVDDVHVTRGVEVVGVDGDELGEESPGHVSSPTPFLHLSSTAKTNIIMKKVN